MIDNNEAISMVDPIGAIAARAPSANGKIISTPKELFDRRVVRLDGCWDWIGSKNAAGYGTLRVGGRGSKSVLAHRLSWVLYNGEIPNKLQVLHECDNPICTNPRHLFLGTNAENIADRIKKGRKGSQAWINAGERHPNAKLTDEDVRRIRELRSSGSMCKDLAKMYGVIPRHISAICLRTARIKKC